MKNQAKPILLFVDADACPVKAEIYRVADRYALDVHIVSNNFIAIPQSPRVKRVLVGDGFDAADDWIAERAVAGDIVITNDIPLAARCIANAAVVIQPNGRLFTEASIGMVLATRNLMQDLRAGGAIMGGPKPFSPRDRSAFLSALDLAIVRLRQKGYVC